ncbi:MAG: hypothetical protein U0132_04890 [Gemmatimonadaceae bacterium]
MGKDYDRDDDDRKPKLPPPSDHRISLRRAVKLTRNYRESIPAADKTGFFHKQAIVDLLRQRGVVGMRYYHGLDDHGQYHLVLVGVDKEFRDIVESRKGKITRLDQSVGAMVTSSSAVILDTHYPCPPNCPPPGPLNM